MIRNKEFGCRNQGLGREHGTFAEGNGAGSYSVIAIKRHMCHLAFRSHSHAELTESCPIPTSSKRENKV